MSHINPMQPSEKVDLLKDKIKKQRAERRLVMEFIADQGDRGTPPEFDLEAARVIRDNMGDMCQETDLICDIFDMFPAALDEIERMRHDVDSLTTALAASGKTIIIGSEAQAKRIAELEAEKKRRLYNYRYRFCFLRSERDAALAAYPKRIAKQRAALKKLGRKYRARCKALVDERARRICHIPREDPAGHWPRYEKVVVDEAREQLRREGLL